MSTEGILESIRALLPAITHHFIVAPHTWEEAGRVLLGREPIAPVF